MSDKIVSDKMSKFPAMHALVYLFTIGWDIICWLMVLVIWMVGGKRLEWANGLWCVVAEDSWLSRTVFKGYGGGTLGHGGWIAESEAGAIGIDTRVEFHEHVHVEQYEVVMMIVSLINIERLVVAVASGNTTDFVLAMIGITQVAGGIIGILSSVIVTKLRGEHAYRGSAHEEAAYARDASWRAKNE